MSDGGHTSPAVRWWTGRPAATSVAMVLVILAIQVVGTTFAAEGQPERRSLDVFAYVLLCAGPLALLWLRRRPPLVLAGVLAILLTYLLVGYPYGPVFLSFVVALVVTSIRGHRAAAIGAAIGLYLG